MVKDRDSWFETGYHRAMGIVTERWAQTEIEGTKSDRSNCQILRSREKFRSMEKNGEGAQPERQCREGTD